MYQLLQNQTGISQMFWFGQQDYFNFLIIELLGPNLEDLFNTCKRKFSLKTVLMLADRMIALIEIIHSKGFVHRDIKPDNFLIGHGPCQNKIFIIDFGLSKKYREAHISATNNLVKNYVHIPFKDGKNLAGTARYASINAHNGIDQTRRDDLESCCYVLLYFIQGSLPWQGLKVIVLIFLSTFASFF